MSLPRTFPYGGTTQDSELRCWLVPGLRVEITVERRFLSTHGEFRCPSATHHSQVRYRFEGRHVTRRHWAVRLFRAINAAGAKYSRAGIPLSVYSGGPVPAVPLIERESEPERYYN